MFEVTEPVRCELPQIDRWPCVNQKKKETSFQLSCPGQNVVDKCKKLEIAGAWKWTITTPGSYDSGLDGDFTCIVSIPHPHPTKLLIL